MKKNLMQVIVMVMLLTGVAQNSVTLPTPVPTIPPGGSR